MPEVLQKMVGSFIRAGLLTIVPFLVSKGIWSPEESTEYVAWLVAGGTALVWSLWEKYRGVLLLKLAIDAPPTTTIPELKQLRHDQTATPPSVLAFALAALVALSFSTACATRGGVQLSPEGTLAVRANQLVSALRSLTGPAGASPLEVLVASKTITATDAVNVATVVKESMLYAQDLATVLKVVDDARDDAERERGLARAAVLVQQISRSLSSASLRVGTEAGRKAVVQILEAASQILLTVGSLFPVPADVSEAARVEETMAWGKDDFWDFLGRVSGWIGRQHEREQCMRDECWTGGVRG